MYGKDRDTGCRLHILQTDGSFERHRYDVGLAEFAEIINEGHDMMIVSRGKWGAYPTSFEKENELVDRAVREASHVDERGV